MPSKLNVKNLNLLYQLKQTDRSIFPAVKDITPKRIHIKLIERSKDDPDINKNLPQLKQVINYKLINQLINKLISIPISILDTIIRASL